MKKRALENYSSIPNLYPPDVIGGVSGRPSTFFRALKKTIWLALLLLASLAPRGAWAQDGPEVISSTYENRFPDEIVFRIKARGPDTIVRATLFYSVAGSGSRTYARPEEFSPGREVETSYSLATNSQQTYIPPATDITYFWLLEDEAGRRLETEPVSFNYMDVRFSWQKAQGDGVTLYWYRGGGDWAEGLLRIVQDALGRLSGDFGVVYQKPIRVLVYDSKRDMDPALPKRSQAFSREIVTLGTKLSDQVLLVLNAGDVQGTLLHELTHMVVHQAAEGPFGALPAWLDEGLAMYSEGELPRGFAQALREAISRDSLLSVQSLSGPTGRPEEVNLFYAQAYSLVKFLIDEYGKEKMGELLMVFKEGSRVDPALQKVYGFNGVGLEVRWRASLGLGPAPGPPARDEPLPTPTPHQPVQQAPSGLPGLALIFLAALVVALVGILGLAAYLLRRRAA